MKIIFDLFIFVIGIVVGCGLVLSEAKTNGYWKRDPTDRKWKWRCKIPYWKDRDKTDTMIDILSKNKKTSNCCICGKKIKNNDVFVGYGDGTGEKFAHQDCYKTKRKINEI